MDRYYIYVVWKNGETSEGFYVARTRQEAIKKSFVKANKDDIFEVCVFKELRNIKF